MSEISDRLFRKTYQEALESNSNNKSIVENHRQQLEKTRSCIKEFAKSRSLDIMVPLGKKAFIRGKLQHTSEITMCHGGSFFSEVTSYQATDIVDQRIKLCDDQLKALEKERNLFIGKQQTVDDQGIEIIEEFNEDKEAEWRRKHKESMKRFKEQEKLERSNRPQPDCESILDEYELMEELEKELKTLDDEKIKNFDAKPQDLPTEPQSPSQVTPIDDTKKDYSVEESKLIAQNNQEIIDLLRNYRAKIKDLLKNVKKTDDKSMNLCLDLLELKEDIEDDIRKLNDSEETDSAVDDDSDSDDQDSVLAGSDSLQLKKRKVRFSEENISHILSEPSSPSQGDSPKVIKIHFQHSKQEVSTSKGLNDDDVIGSPGEVLAKFRKTVVARKSILKNQVVKDDSKVEKMMEPQETIVRKIYESDPIMGDVLERKNVEEIINVTSKSVGPKKISKFKQMRSNM